MVRQAHHDKLVTLGLSKGGFPITTSGMTGKAMNLMKSIWCLTAVIILLAGTVFAKDISFEASLERNMIYLGESVQLNLQFQGTTDVPAPALPAVDGLQSRYAGPSTMMSIVNGRMSSSITHIYSIVPIKTGKFQIGPLKIEHEGNTYSSNAFTLEVLDNASRGSGHAQQQRKPDINLGDRVFLKMQAAKLRAYLNEAVPLTIKLYISNLGVRDIQFPEFNHDDVSAVDFDKPLQYQEEKGGTVYDVVEFRTQLFGTKSGEFRLGPAKLKANVITRQKRRTPSSPFDDFFRDEFFGGYEAAPIELSSNALTLSILPFPDKKPADFKGAVGDFRLNVEASPSEVKVGDPVTLKMIITGNGNLTSVTSPSLKHSEDFKTYEQQGKQEGGSKIFEQVLIPLTASVNKLPEISFSFFNPEKGQYQTLVRGDIPVKVTASDNRENAAILDAPQPGARPVKKEIYGRDIIYIKESPGELKKKGDYLYRNIFFILFQLVPLLVLAAALILKKQKEKIGSDTGYARRLSAPKKAKKGILEAGHFISRNMPAEFYDSVFKTIREYLGNRFHVPSGGITAGVVNDLLKGKNIDPAFLGKLTNIFTACDMARYAPTAPDTMKMQETLNEMKEVIDYLERHRE
ncbi:MAG: protein BatD [Nitrospirae bacterium]|nr:protein BatD [Nitrospirota bacterium]